MKEPSEKDVLEWKIVYNEYKPFLCPNVKTAFEVLEYLKGKYTLREEDSETLKNIVVFNVKMNEYSASKIPLDKEIKPVVFTVLNQGNGQVLYESQDDIYKGSPIYLGVELLTGYFLIEGSDELADEVTAFKGLDTQDLGNFYLVANYVRCLKKYDMLNIIKK